MGERGKGVGERGWDREVRGVGERGKGRGGER